MAAATSIATGAKAAQSEALKNLERETIRRL